jgi:hypothetical protein
MSIIKSLTKIVNQKIGNIAKTLITSSFDAVNDGLKKIRAWTNDSSGQPNP